MTLPRIPALETATLSTLPAEYPELFAEKIQIKASPNGDWSLSVAFIPYNYDTGTIMPGGRKTMLSVGDINAKAVEYPNTIGVLMGTMVTLLPLLLQEQHLERQIAELEEGADATELQASLAAVQTQLVGE